MAGSRTTGREHGDERLRVAVVQGASRGLGLAFVEALLARPDVDRVVATSRSPDSSEGLLSLRERYGEALLCVPLDLRREESVRRAAAETQARFGPRIHWLINCAGLLHGDDWGPEKRLEDVDPERLAAVFEVNAFGPLVVTRHFLELLRHDERAIVANVSARVGSIGDNRRGGWYAYRASKAAQNMFTRTLALELARRASNIVCLALHPGTVDTDLSRPFQRNVPPEQLFEPSRAAEQLLRVMDDCSSESTGRFFAWDGQEIPW
jgi:NAD(P)-dependent dehydrogenase (short-subunit alcohol dehydrogenase family)